METTTLNLRAQRGAIAAQDATLPLRDAVQRALRGQASWTVLALHLSRLAPPAPKPHHRRIARAVLEEAASRSSGQLFTLVNGDFALLMSAEDDGAGLSTTLGDLFAADAGDPSLILTRWLMPDQVREFEAFLDALPTLMAAPGSTEQDSGLAAVTTLFNAVDPRRVRDLLIRQTGVVVPIGGAERVHPVYREIRFSLSTLEARAMASGVIASDPFLFRHLIAKLDSMMLGAATADLGHDRPLLAGVKAAGLTLHIDMSLETVLSSAFADFAKAAQETEIKVAVEVAMVEAFADTVAFATARDRVRSAGFALVLDDISHHALTVTKPAALGCDWFKLDWSNQLLQSGDMLDSALAAVDPLKVILNKADTESAIRWGIVRNIRRFQGRHIDAILAAGRLVSCPSSGVCTLRKCIEREAGTTLTARAGCSNLPLLDTSMSNMNRAA